MSLAEIKEIVKQRTPKMIYELLERQITHIDERIDDWVRARKLLHTLKKTIHYVMDIDEAAITIQFLPSEAIVLGDINDYSQERDDYDALFSFYRICRDKYPDLDMNYPAWGMFSEERIKSRDWVWPDRYYFYNPEGHDKKPAALYAVGYKRGGYGQSHDLYVRLLDYIDANGFEICGPAYEEYPLNEICVPDDGNYLMRVMVTVKSAVP